MRFPSRVLRPRLLRSTELIFGPTDRDRARAQQGRLSAVLFLLASVYGLMVIPSTDSDHLTALLVVVGLGVAAAALFALLPWARLPDWAILLPPGLAVVLLSVGTAGFAGSLENYAVLFPMILVFVGWTRRPGAATVVGIFAIALLALAFAFGEQASAHVELVAAVLVSAVIGEMISLATTWQRHARSEVLLLNTSLTRLIAAGDADQAAELTAAMAAELLEADGAVVMTPDEPGSSVLVPRGGVREGQDVGARTDVGEEKSGLALAAATGRPLFVDRAAESDLLAQRFVTAYDLGSVLFLPLNGSAGVLGVLTVWWHEPGRHLDRFARQVMELLSGQASLVLERLDEVRWLDLAATTDPLTGVANRRTFTAALSNVPPGTGVLMFDLDGFKQANDEHGHAAGDRVLVEFAQVLRGSVRETDLVARLGGDEFAAVLIGADGAELAEDVRQRLADSWDRPLGVGFSLGLGVVGRDEPVAEVLDRADRALYAHKAERRLRPVPDIVSPVPDDLTA